MERVDYDEFGYFHENAEEYGIYYPGPPSVRRVGVELGDGRRLSALIWGDSDPELVLLHGGAQNAHTWDTVALALGRPLVAVDLPGHSHSDASAKDMSPLDGIGRDLAEAVRRLAPRANAIAGMSLGGLGAISMCAVDPTLVRRLVLVDITPGVTERKASAITSFISGPESFATFQEILDRTVAFNPTRSVASLRRGVLHNAVQRDDGRWVWRYARHPVPDSRPYEAVDRSAGSGDPPNFSDLWNTISSIEVPIMLVRGMAAGSVVDDDDEAELLKRRPNARIERVQGAGHSVQGDAPVELAKLIESFIDQ